MKILSQSSSVFPPYPPIAGRVRSGEYRTRPVRLLDDSDDSDDSGAVSPVKWDTRDAWGPSVRETLHHASGASLSQNLAKRDGHVAAPCGDIGRPSLIRTHRVYVDKVLLATHLPCAIVALCQRSARG